MTLLRLTSRCPGCGRAEARRVFPWELEHPGLPTETVSCKCGTRYVVLARHYQEAELCGRR